MKLKDLKELKLSKDSLEKSETDYKKFYLDRYHEWGEIQCNLRKNKKPKMWSINLEKL